MGRVARGEAETLPELTEITPNEQFSLLGVMRGFQLQLLIEAV